MVVLVVFNHSAVSDSFASPWTARFLCLWEFPGKNTGVGCHILLQGFFPTQGSNPHLLHWQVGSLPLSHLESPFPPFTFIKVIVTFNTCKVIRYTYISCMYLSVHKSICREKHTNKNMHEKYLIFHMFRSFSVCDLPDACPSQDLQNRIYISLPPRYIPQALIPSSESH